MCCSDVRFSSSVFIRSLLYKIFMQFHCRTMSLEICVRRNHRAKAKKTTMKSSWMMDQWVKTSVEKSKRVKWTVSCLRANIDSISGVMTLEYHSLLALLRPSSISNEQRHTQSSLISCARQAIIGRSSCVNGEKLIEIWKWSEVKWQISRIDTKWEAKEVTVPFGQFHFGIFSQTNQQRCVNFKENL